MKEVKLHSQVQESLDRYDLQYKVIGCDPKLADTAAFCKEYGYTLDQSANAIVVASRKIEPTQYTLCIVLATTRLDVNKAVVKKMGIKRASFADAQATQNLTNMEIGGVTAPGVEAMPIFIDSAVMNVDEVVMGGGNRSSKLVLRPHELTKLPNIDIVENLAKPM